GGVDGKAYSAGQGTVWRWREAYQNDFAARMDWCVKARGEANHPPVVRLGQGEVLPARAGEVIRLDASGSTDPDGDRLSYEWMYYPEAGTYRGPLEVHGAATPVGRLKAPRVEGAKEAHIILKVRDDGTPPLTRYRRVRIALGPPDAGAEAEGTGR